MEQRSRELQDMLESLRQGLAAQLQLVEDELAALPCFGPFAAVQHKDVLKRAYMLGFARLALGLEEVDEVLAWLNSLHTQYPRPAAPDLH
jgi:hypothetical protein